MQATDAINYGGIQITADRLMETDGGRVMVLVPRDEVRNILLRYGFRSRHPIAQLVIGIVLALTAVIPIAHLIDWSVNGGTFFEAELGLIVLAVIGVYLILDAPRRGYALEVTSTKGKYSLDFPKGSDAAQVRAVADAARQRFGYEISDDLPR